MSFSVQVRPQPAFKILIETHSDHVLNGIRLAVQGRKARRRLNVAFYHSKWELGAKSPFVDIVKHR